MVDPAAGGVVYLPWYAWYKLYGEDFIKKVGEVRPQIYSATNPGSAALASGDIAVLFNASETGLMPLQAAGAPLRWAFPEPATGPVTGQAIDARAPHPNAAKLYHEYAFTAEGYGLWQKLGGAPARIGFKDQRPIAAEPWYKYPDEVPRRRPEGRDGALSDDLGPVPQVDQRAAVTASADAARRLKARAQRLRLPRNAIRRSRS